MQLNRFLMLWDAWRVSHRRLKCQNWESHTEIVLAIYQFLCQCLSGDAQAPGESKLRESKPKICCFAPSLCQWLSVASRRVVRRKWGSIPKILSFRELTSCHRFSGGAPASGASVSGETIPKNRFFAFRLFVLSFLSGGAQASEASTSDEAVPRFFEIRTDLVTLAVRRRMRVKSVHIRRSHSKTAV